jgi:hypothetical protein
MSNSRISDRESATPSSVSIRISSIRQPRHQHQTHATNQARQCVVDFGKWFRARLFLVGSFCTLVWHSTLLLPSRLSTWRLDGSQDIIGRQWHRSDLPMGCQIKLSGVSKNIDSILMITRLALVFDVYGSRKVAINDFRCTTCSDGSFSPQR